MRYVVLALAAVWLAIAITVAYAPQSVPEWLAVEEIGPWMRALALVPLAMGAAFFFGAPRFHARIYLRVIGILAMIKGLFLLVAPVSISVGLMSWYMSLPAWYLRVSGFVSGALALVVVIVAMISLFEEDVI